MGGQRRGGALACPAMPASAQEPRVHPVLAALLDPAPHDRIALVIEGGGMRGAVSGGMAVGLDELGLTRRFSAAFGSSAGSLNAMWLIAGRIETGAATWIDPELNRTLIDRRRVIRGGPLVDMRRLVEEVYESVSPGLFAAVLASPAELHPLATDADRGICVDLHPEIRDQRTLRLSLRASAALPFAAGGAVALGGRRYLDAGLSAAIPFRAALSAGATHVLVLRSRRAGDVVRPPHGLQRRLLAPLLGRISPLVTSLVLSRPEREAIDEADLERLEADPAGGAHILSVRPGPDSAVPSRLESDTGIVRAGFEAGREAIRATFGA